MKMTITQDEYNALTSGQLADLERDGVEIVIYDAVETYVGQSNPQFALDDLQTQKLADWIAVQNAAAIEKQKREMKNPSEFVKSCWEDGYPYSGAAGGSLTYSFTPTSLGVIAVVRDGHTGEEINLTDYESW